MAKGRPRKKKEVTDLSPAEVPAVETKSDGVTVIDPPVVASGKKALTPVEESRTVLEHPLDPGQQFFESPEGFIVIGEKDRGRVWCRAANDGKGMWVNPMR